MTEITDFPSYIITPEKVYKLSIEEQDSRRAFDRYLIDFHIMGENPVDGSDDFSTLVGMSRELYDDYPSFHIPIDLGWILIRFLSQHIQTNSLNLRYFRLIS